MKPSTKWTALLLALATGLVAAGSAFAGGRHHHHHSRLVLGFSFGYPAYYYGGPYYHPYPYYYPAPVIVQSPPVYTERQDVAPEPGYWYYCAATRGYYPYVKECPGGWQRVAPAPAPQN
jgi:hypothetical protein